MQYDTFLALKDGEMRDPAAEQHIANRNVGSPKPLEPLESGQVQCNSCHDPHIRDDANDSNIKFLRLNRLQKVAPSQSGFNPQTDIICLACHDKTGWVNSAHAHPNVADETYTTTAARVREIPQGTQVWQSACLACHDTHAVQGTRRLLREGTDGPEINIDGYPVKQGGRPALEQTCYACHSSDGGTLTAQGQATEVPDIKFDFALNTHMPITSDEQANGLYSPNEIHDIGNSPGTEQAGADFIESQQQLSKHHVECTDCHNPHRVIKNRRINSDAALPDSAGTHPHNTADVLTTPEGMHTNIASGVLRGMWGVEPQYSSSDFSAPVETITYNIKRGSVTNLNSVDIEQAYVTREYQICLKCHSNYAYGNNPPMLGSFSNGTFPGTNGMFQYTNQAKEFQAPDSHKGEGTALTPGGAFSGFANGQNYNVDFQTDNHRSWHPVMRETGRTALPGGGGIRDADANNWLSPFNLAVGTQTMYCSDCHGSNTANNTVVPDGNLNNENGRVWGPHGSENDFILKGPWSGDRFTGTGTGTQNHLCFKCHDYNQYANPNGFATSIRSGFQTKGACMNCGGSTLNSLHIYHAGVVANFRCTICHIAVPHGWKNKAFLVNLNDVGTEAGLSPGTQVRNGSGGFGGGPGFLQPGYTQGPYYNRAGLKVHTFTTSGNWTPGHCGSVGPPGNGQTGVNWMAFSSEACMNLP